MKPSSIVISSLVITTALTLIVPDADARRRGRSEWSRYQEAELHDRLEARTDVPGVVVLDRDELQLGMKGESVRAEIEREFVVYVRDPGGMSDYETFSIDDYPGFEVKKLQAWKVTRDDEREVDVDRSVLGGCEDDEGRKRYSADFGDLRAGDVLVVQIEAEIDGLNPLYEHWFDRELPILQSDILMEVPRDLLEGSEGAGWHWWAGAVPQAIEREAWEKPTTWRFRWGATDVPPVADNVRPRRVSTAWIVDLGQARRGQMTAGDPNLGGGETLRGARLSATQLTGRLDVTNDIGHKNDDSRVSVVSDASHGSLRWDLVTANWASRVFEPRITKSSDVKHLAERAADGVTDLAELARRIVRDVNERVGTVDVPIAYGLNDIDLPEVIARRDCATPVEKAVLVAAMLREQGVASHPVFVSRSPIQDAESLASLRLFDGIALVTAQGAQPLYIDLASGNVATDLSGYDYQTALTLPLDGSEGRLVVKPDLAALTAAPN